MNRDGERRVGEINNALLALAGSCMLLAAVVTGFQLKPPPPKFAPLTCCPFDPRQPPSAPTRPHAGSKTPSLGNAAPRD